MGRAQAGARRLRRRGRPCDDGGRSRTPLGRTAEAQGRRASAQRARTRSAKGISASGRTGSALGRASLRVGASALADRRPGRGATEVQRGTNNGPECKRSKPVAEGKGRGFSADLNVRFGSPAVRPLRSLRLESGHHTCQNEACRNAGVTSSSPVGGTSFFMALPVGKAETAAVSAFPVWVLLGSLWVGNGGRPGASRFHVGKCRLLPAKNERGSVAAR